MKENLPKENIIKRKGSFIWRVGGEHNKHVRDHGDRLHGEPVALPDPSVYVGVETEHLETFSVLRLQE